LQNLKGWCPMSYLGLNPSVNNPGKDAYHDRITKQGRGQARSMLVEAAWAAARSPRSLRAFFRKVAVRRGQPIAAVATARKTAMIIADMLIKADGSSRFDGPNSSDPSNSERESPGAQRRAPATLQQLQKLQKPKTPAIQNVRTKQHPHGLIDLDLE
jgi:hypothetical protein